MASHGRLLRLRMWRRHPHCYTLARPNFPALSSRSLGPPNDTVYTSLLTLIQRQSMPERAADVWTAVKADGVRQTPHIFSSLFAACAPGASPALVEAALEAADAMQAQWAEAAAAPRPPRRQYER